MLCDSHSVAKPRTTLWGGRNVLTNTAKLGTIPYRRFFKRPFIIAKPGWQVQVLPKIRTRVREMRSRKPRRRKKLGAFGHWGRFGCRVQKCGNFLQIARGKRTIMV